MIPTFIRTVYNKKRASSKTDAKRLFYKQEGEASPYAPAPRENFFAQSFCTGNHSPPKISFAVEHREATTRFPTTSESRLRKFGKLQDEFATPQR
jgi:hypothetical protein